MKELFLTRARHNLAKSAFSYSITDSGASHVKINIDLAKTWSPQTSHFCLNWLMVPGLLRKGH